MQPEAIPVGVKFVHLVSGSHDQIEGAFHDSLRPPFNSSSMICVGFLCEKNSSGCDERFSLHSKDRSQRAQGIASLFRSISFHPSTRLGGQREKKNLRY